MADKIYGFAIVGCGAIGTFHAKQLRHVDRARLVAVCAPRLEAAQRLAEQFHCKAYASLEAMLQDEAIDIVNICTPSSLHGEQAIACAKAKKHVITEKPMDITLEKANLMIEAFRSSGTRLSVISQHRLDGSVSKVKRLIDNGMFGNLVMGNGAVNWYRSQTYYDSSNWRGTWQGDGGGALMNQGIHAVDVLQYLMGPVKSVFAYCETLGHERIEVEDAAAAVLKFANGAIGTIVGTTAAFPGLSTRIEIFGTKGSAVIEDDILVYCQYQKPGSDNPEQLINESEHANDQAGKGAANPMTIDGQSHVMQFNDMIQAIEEQREPLVNGMEGRKPLEVITAIYQSNQSGGVIELHM